MNEISKAGALCKLHEIAHQYLVGPGSWPIAFEHLPIFRAVIRDFELEEDVPDMPGEFRSTAPGQCSLRLALSLSHTPPLGRKVIDGNGVTLRSRCHSIEKRCAIVISNRTASIMAKRWPMQMRGP